MANVFDTPISVCANTSDRQIYLYRFWHHLARVYKALEKTCEMNRYVVARHQTGNVVIAGRLDFDD